MDDFKAKLQVFGSNNGRTLTEIEMLWTAVFNADIRVLPRLLSSDLDKLKTKFNENNAEFLLQFIRSLPLDAVVLGAIGITDSKDVKKITKSKYKNVGSLFDISDNEESIKKGLGIDRPASATLWKFAERFARQATGKIMLAMLADTFN